MAEIMPERKGQNQHSRCHSHSPQLLSFSIMIAHGLTPILNVSDIAASFAWFEKWGWKKCWDWGTPPTFGAVGSGTCEIVLCQGGQGGRGRGENTTTFQNDGDEEADRGVWMSVWVEDMMRPTENASQRDLT